MQTTCRRFTLQMDGAEATCTPGGVLWTMARWKDLNVYWIMIMGGRREVRTKVHTMSNDLRQRRHESCRLRSSITWVRMLLGSLHGNGYCIQR